MKNKSDEKLITEYQDLVIAQSAAQFDLDILRDIVTDNDIKKSEFFKEYSKLNENLAQIKKELLSRGILKNKLIIPTFPTFELKDNATQV